MCLFSEQQFVPHVAVLSQSNTRIAVMKQLSANQILELLSRVEINLFPILFLQTGLTIFTSIFIDCLNNLKLGTAVYFGGTINFSTDFRRMFRSGKKIVQK